MFNNIRKYLEYTFFIFINLFLWMPIYKQILVNCGYIAEFISVIILKANPKEIADIDDPTGIIILFSIIFTIFLIKPFLFHFLYVFKNIFPNIHNFFDNIRINRQFMWWVLFGAFSFDIISILFFDIGFLGFLGLTFNYILYLLFFLPVKKNNVDNNGRIIKQQNSIMKIITIIILSFVLFLLLLAICPIIILFFMRLFI